ncbi:MAG: helix-turn-helix domain-containing protein [Egibacteraceae bacterium]
MGAGGWDARLVRALRTALRMSQENFGQHLGFAGRTIRAWEAGTRISSDSQQMLDVALARADREAKMRFDMLADGKRRGGLRSGASWTREPSEP